MTFIPEDIIRETELKALDDFILGLTKLSKETKVTISGCGCCGSPQLYYNPKEDYSNITYIHEDGDNVKPLFKQTP